jgi:hypothetical protein
LFQKIGCLAFDDFAGLDATGANAHTLAYAVHLGLDGLEVDVPAAPGGVMGVGDVIAELRAFAAEITFSCHDLLQSRFADTPRDRTRGIQGSNGAVDEVGTRRLKLLTSTLSRDSAESLS